MELMRRQVTAAILAAMFFAVPGMTHDRNDRESGYRYGYEAGYRDGFDHAREDYHRGVGYGLRSREYRKAEHGYQKWMGKKGEYKKGYRILLTANSTAQRSRNPKKTHHKDTKNDTGKTVADLCALRVFVVCNSDSDPAAARRPVSPRRHGS